MIKKYSIFLQLTVLTSAFFISCQKNDDEIGKSSQEKEGVLSHYVLENEINLNLSSIISNDSLITSGSDLIHVGQFTDTYSGTTESKSFFQVNIASDYPDFTVSTCDSIVLRLAFSANLATNRILQGDTSKTNTINVHLLNEAFVTGQSYYNTQSLNYESLPLGSLSFKPSQVNPYIDIKLPASLGNSLMQNASLKSKEDFLANFKGLALTNSADDGSIVAYNLNSAASFLLVYYTQNTVNKNYFFDLSTSLRHHINISSDKSATNFSALNKAIPTSATDTDSKLLLQSGVGSSILVKIEDLLSLIDTSKKLIVNKAIIRLPILSNSNTTQINEGVYLLKAYEANENGQILYNEASKKQLIPDYNYIYASGTGFFALSSDKSYYELDLTYYIQEYLLGKRDLNPILITPNAVTTTVNFQARTNRSVIDASKVSMKIYYSDL